MSALISLTRRSSKCCGKLILKVEYLRYIVSSDGVETDPEKVQTVTEWPQPLHQRDVCLFLGTAGYCRRFIPQYSEEAKPLTQLTGNIAPSKISGDCVRAFSVLCAVHLHLHKDFCSGYRCQHFDCYLLGKEFVVRNASHSGQVARWREMQMDRPDNSVRTAHNARRSLVRR